jgi:hypothetical protein
MCEHLREKTAPVHSFVFGLCTHVFRGHHRSLPRSDHPVAGRLARAKEQLRRRLTRRGWALSAAAVTTILTGKALAVPLPVGLAASTMVYISGKSANTSALAVKVVALSDGVLRMMWLNKMKMASGVVLAVVVAGTGIGLVVRETWAGGGEGQVAEEPAARAQNAAPKADAQEGTKAEIEGLRKEVDALNRKLDAALKDIAVLKALRGINDVCVEIGKQTAPPPTGAFHQKNSSIESLFEGIPSDLRSKVQGGKAVAFRARIRTVGTSRMDDGNYVVRLQLDFPNVTVLGDTWNVLLRSPAKARAKAARA